MDWDWEGLFVTAVFGLWYYLLLVEPVGNALNEIRIWYFHPNSGRKAYKARKLADAMEEQHRRDAVRDRARELRLAAKREAKLDRGRTG